MLGAAFRIREMHFDSHSKSRVEGFRPSAEFSEIHQNRWDTRAKKANNSVERFKVPLLPMLLFSLKWRTPLGSANETIA
jgi:hypothetical protein